MKLMPLHVVGRPRNAIIMIIVHAMYARGVVQLPCMVHTIPWADLESIGFSARGAPIVF